jgi:very-short-patch-repair endonuclease
MIMTINNKQVLRRRKELRNNATPEEIILWYYLKASQTGFKFKRQTSIGYYIVDFYCPLLRYVIEIDGSQHNENKEYDQERSNFLVAQGCTVRRFWNNELHQQLSNVLDTIMLDLQKLTTTPARTSPPLL